MIEVVVEEPETTLVEKIKEQGRKMRR